MVATAQPVSSQCWNPARIGRICLECAAIFRHLAVNGPVSAWGLYNSDDDQTKLTIGAAVFGFPGGAGNVANARASAKGYPEYLRARSIRRHRHYPPGGYPADYRRAPAAPDFDALEEDDDAPNAQSSTALPPPGPDLSPDGSALRPPHAEPRRFYTEARRAHRPNPFAR